MQCFAHEPLYDIDPRTGASIEVFYADRTLETFGRYGAGWFWCSRQRGYPPWGEPTDLPYELRMICSRVNMRHPSVTCTAQLWLTHNVNADTVRTRRFFEDGRSS